jgi:hypothetical protein
VRLFRSNAKKKYSVTKYGIPSRSRISVCTGTDTKFQTLIAVAKALANAGADLLNESDNSGLFLGFPSLSVLQ